MAKSVLVSKTDRAKMDVMVTSRHKAVLCLEWSKVTSRTNNIVGVGSQTPCHTGAPLNPLAVTRHQGTVDMAAQLPRESFTARGLSRTLADPHDCDVLSTHIRSTRCAADMTRGSGRSTSPGTAPASPAAAAGGLPCGGSPSLSAAGAGRRPPASVDPATRSSVSAAKMLSLGPSGGGRPASAGPAAAAAAATAGHEAASGGASPAEHGRKQGAAAAAAAVAGAAQEESLSRPHLQYGFDAELNYVRPSSRSVDMARMCGRESEVVGGRQRFDYGQFMDVNPSTRALSQHKRCVGGDFGRAVGRTSPEVPQHVARDVKWAGVDKAVRGVSFGGRGGGSSARGSSAKADARQWYVAAHDPVAPLCTRWNGSSCQMWAGDSYAAVQTRPPSVAAARASHTSSRSAVIRSAGAHINMVRSTLLRHTREGERKRKERLAMYSADSRLADRDLTQAFHLAYGIS